MEQILDFVTKFGLPVFVIASCIIVLIGILKLTKMFNKISNSSVKKLIYYALVVAFAFGGVAIYFKCFGVDFNTYIVFCMTQISATTTLYAIYENFGIRSLVRIMLSWMATWFKKNPEHKFTKAAKALGLSSEKIESLIAEVAKKDEAVQNINK